MRALCLATFLALTSLPSIAQQTDAREQVRAIVQSELAADAKDHARWMYRDANRTPGKSTVNLVVETADGSLSKTIEINGQPPTPQQEKADEQKMRHFVTDAGARRKQRQNEKQDDEHTAALTRMLPDAFLWTVAAQNGEDMTLNFTPDPSFTPPTYPARVFAAMAGSMVVDVKEKRIKALKGKLTREVQFGYGILGKLQPGGTFDVERHKLATGVWEITSTHVHISGHALLFKNIGAQQDETTSGYKPAPDGLTLEQAEKMLNDGTVAKEVGVASAPAKEKP